MRERRTETIVGEVFHIINPEAGNQEIYGERMEAVFGERHLVLDLNLFTAVTLNLQYHIIRDTFSKIT